MELVHLVHSRTMDIARGLKHMGWIAPLALASLNVAHAAAVTTAAEVSEFLELVSVPDGRCQILSAGGQLRVLYNRHQSRAIDYRLIRSFAGDHPQGRVAGVVTAGDEGVKLGCTKVDGRPQDWHIERARFSD